MDSETGRNLRFLGVNSEIFEHWKSCGICMIESERIWKVEVMMYRDTWFDTYEWQKYNASFLVEVLHDLWPSWLVLGRVLKIETKWHPASLCLTFWPSEKCMFRSSEWKNCEPSEVGLPFEIVAFTALHLALAPSDGMTSGFLRKGMRAMSCMSCWANTLIRLNKCLVYA